MNLIRIRTEKTMTSILAPLLLLPPPGPHRNPLPFNSSLSSLHPLLLPPSSSSFCKIRSLHTQKKWPVFQAPPTLNLTQDEAGDGEDDFKVLAAIQSFYNHIVIVETQESRMLLLDYTHNVHSIYRKGQTWTRSYWDEFASLPAIIPKGPIAILGLGGGTAANLMLDLWPSLELEGWEIDQLLIDKARDYLGLSELEKQTPKGGILKVNVGDALSSSVNIPGGYAGIVVDLFSNGEILPQLKEEATWLELFAKLMPNGRIMVNCGAARDGPLEQVSPDTDNTWLLNSTVKAMCKAFPGQVSWKNMPKENGLNCMALTGPLPDLKTWSSLLPDPLSSSIQQWASC
ncbi:uncharacterized protein LOC124919487 [Impatiens glandulifera]|uniref:uncharacterized protein LOC124919487 n=1 Tax=Impatiens glandulifera TaxID=253017 RepID=UPI001FB0A368|nr:uncharacterized protein LOC124919487 [Impatiens glandulifera]